MALHPMKLIAQAMQEGKITEEQALLSSQQLGVNGDLQQLTSFWTERQWLSKADIQACLQALKQTKPPSKKPSSSSKSKRPIRTIAMQSTSDSFSAKPTDEQEPLPTIDAQWHPEEDVSKRYTEGVRLGSGGLGIVKEVVDRNLGRKVARKTLLKGDAASPKDLERFIQEARLTGQLEHPNIIPIYELGIMPDEQLYYTMRLLPSSDLDQAIYHEERSLLEQIKILQQVCMGLEYAHSQGVIHRDVKPANILLGQFGEVYLLDWGLAKADKQQGKGVNFQTEALEGTPNYMAPELLQHGDVTPLTDQYALGVILYEVLTHTLPFESPNLYALMNQICTQVPITPSQRAPARDIPEDLETICMNILSKQPQDRYDSCRAVYDKLEEFIEGTKEKQRKQRAAKQRIKEAKQLTKRYHQQLKQVERFYDLWREAKRDQEPWAPLPEKRPVWQMKTRYTQAKQESIELFRSIIMTYEQALEHEARNPIAREGLAQLYWEKFLEAERLHDTFGQVYYRDAAASYNDGPLTALLKGDGTFQIKTQPSGANITLFRYEEEDGRLAPFKLKTLPKRSRKSKLPMGSYLLHIEKEGYQSFKLPFRLGRCEDVSLNVSLYPKDSWDERYVLIPESSFYVGGDTEAQMHQPRSLQHEADFLISRYPVTFREYLVYLNEIHKTSPKRAKSLAPRIQQETYVTLQDGQYIPNYDTLFSGPITKRYPAGQGHEWTLPVFGITWYEAVLYCRWRTQQEGRLVTLPSEHQWEKAAAGADERMYPWGNHFDANFCKMGRSRPPEELQPEPIGTFLFDESPYGVCDMVGTISEWTRHKDIEALAALKKDPKWNPIQRGGGWICSTEKQIRIGSRLPRPEGSRSYNSGFRVVIPLKPTKNAKKKSTRAKKKT